MTPKEAITLVKECGLNIEGIKHDECEKVILNALEKQIPKKLNFRKGNKRVYAECPNCHITLTYEEKTKASFWQLNHCFECGQALDWSDTE